MKSMTGFGTFKKELSEGYIEATVRSVNSRFLEIKTSLPKEYYFIESDMRELISHYALRGRIDIYFYRNKKMKKSIKIDPFQVKAWLSEIKKISSHFKQKEISVDTLLGLPNVIQIEDEKQISVDEKKSVLVVLEAALKKLNLERQREGVKIQKELIKYSQELKSNTEKFESLKVEANEFLQKKFKEKYENLKLSKDIADSRLMQEVALLIDKSDISEEISRLYSHIEEYIKLIKSSESNGKKLDFYTQELLRELNTIGSKTPTAHLTQLVVNSKTIVEKMREQVQNIE